MAEYNGHLFRFRDPNDPNKWIDIPILYQTMYAAYLAYCEEHGIVESARLSEDAYYTTLGTLKSIADTLTGYGGTIPLSSGGTGAAVGTKLELLQYLGLLSSLDTEDVSDETFPSTAIVKHYVDTMGKALANSIGGGVAEAKEYADTLNKSLSLESLGIYSGTANPDTSTRGAIYIKYS